MSFLSKIAGGLVKALPVAGLFAPQSKRLTQALGTLQAVGGALPGVGSNPIIQTLTGITGGLTKPVSAILSPKGVPMSLAASTLPALPRVAAASTAIATVGRGLVRRYGKKAMAALNLFAVGSIVYDAATGQAVGTRYTRKINPLNHKELRFAIRRVKASARVGRQIEKVLGKGSLSRLSRC